LACLDPTEVQKIRNDSQQVLLAATDPRDVVALLGSGWTAESEAK
jgi:hypothetical protein